MPLVKRIDYKICERITKNSYNKRYKKLVISNPIRNINNDNNSNTYQVLNNYQNIVTSKSSLNFFYAKLWSICSPGKHNEFLCILHSFLKCIRIILLVETWIKSDEQAQQLWIKNYVYYTTSDLASSVVAYQYMSTIT